MSYATSQIAGLPDPDTQREFYSDVTSKRLFAFVIDSILIILITLIFVPLTAFVALIFWGFFSLVISFIYRTVSLANSSATPGMRLMSIEFRNHHGEKLDFGTAFLHTLMFTVSMSMVVPQVISIILMLTSPRGQGLSDMLLGTAVINKSARN